MYKLIAIDIDGTLLKNDKSISMENIQAIKKAKDKGIKVVLSTGRPIQGALKYCKQLNLMDNDDYSIACSGAFIQCMGTKKIIDKHNLTYDEFNFLYNMSKKLKITLNVLADDVLLTPTRNLTTQLEAFMSDLKVKVVDFDKLNKNININRIVYINETKPFISHLNNVIKKNNLNFITPDFIYGNENVCFNDKNLPKDLFEKFTVLKASSNTLEILKKGINKGTAVETLAQKLGIKPQEIICVGDSGNDIAMIKYAGLGVAMGNAFPQVKKVANYITYTNEENGLAHVINKFILEKNQEKAV